MSNTSNFQTINQTDTHYSMGPPIQGKSFKGIDYQLQRNKTLDDCQKMCLNDNKCFFIDFDNGQNLCTLRGATVNQGYVSGIKNIDTYDTYNNTQLTGTPVTNSIPTNQTNCQNLCTNNPDCDAYVYSNNLCTLQKLDNSPHHTHVWKANVKQSNVTDLSSLNNMYCCMNYPEATNCKDYLPNSKNCDIFMTDFCSKNPYMTECQCINRQKNHQYNKVKSELSSRTNTPIQDDCWYPPCRTGSTSYIPTTMVPISVSFYDQDHLTKVDNLKCVGSKVCNIEDIYNPNLTNSCNTMQLKNPSMQASSNISGNTIPNNGGSVWSGNLLTTSQPASNQNIVSVSSGTPSNSNGQALLPGVPPGVMPNSSTNLQKSQNGQSISITQSPGISTVTTASMGNPTTGNYTSVSTSSPNTNLSLSGKTSINTSPSINSSGSILTGTNISSSNTNSTSNINSSQSIMEQFEQLEGFDQENTSRYSSFDPVRGIENAATNTYDFINVYNPLPTIGKYASNLYDDVTSGVTTGYHGLKSGLSGFYKSANEGVSSIGIQDFYASDPSSVMLRNGMQSPNLTAGVDEMLRAGTFNKTVMVPVQTRPIVKPKDTSLFDNNSLVFVVLLLIIFILYRYWAKRS